MSTAFHYFIAIPLPESVRHFFSIWQDELKGKLSYKQWTHPSDLHITLKFIGPVDDNKRNQLNQALQSVRKFSAFTIDVGSMGSFGDPTKPRVLWAGVEKTAELAALQTRAEVLLRDIGFQIETRAYRPHITLAKKWHGDAACNLLKTIKKQYTGQQDILVESLVLYQTHPISTPKYEPVWTYRLQGGE